MSEEAAQLGFLLETGSDLSPFPRWFGRHAPCLHALVGRLRRPRHRPVCAIKAAQFDRPGTAAVGVLGLHRLRKGIHPPATDSGAFLAASQGHSCCSMTNDERHRGLLEEVVDWLSAVGIPIQQVHAKRTPCQ
jgi:hypothetical protein